MEIAKLIVLFKEQFDSGITDDKKAMRIFFAPARVNLIGEHTDYNGGYVLPSALNFGIYLVIRKNNDGVVRVSSEQFSDTIEVLANDMPQEKVHQWFDYPLGTMKFLWNEANRKQKQCEPLCGMDMFFYSNMPTSAGLSSSAAMEMVTAFACNEIFSMDFKIIDLIKLCQEVENYYIGVNCGIMDQFAVGASKKDSAILLNCTTLQHEYIPLNLTTDSANPLSVVVMNTNKPRNLIMSKYNERRAECEAAVEKISVKKKITFLSELNVSEFHELADEIFSDRGDPLYMRALHVVEENERVLLSASLLKKNDFESFGEYMVASHVSIRDYYEVSGRELDTLVEEALKIDGLVGARMTGAGFGGCAVAILRTASVPLLEEKVSAVYYSKIGYSPSFYHVHFNGGVKEILH